ncbi:hypothetical protein LTR16_002631 [Cryomyces antarcticus]|uniref:Uncharacterized protein n=1 Tax=Cryomyces antarcticus TaxID=329879 RepID=A0ABR0LYM3_9PEZI|nr:hypothetical protein LTR60_002358 [Cryomyces antarcticus]KAK5017274.1 hypothetical protein LTR39_001633 [Cryomyces antarcticus]KAK5256698.1 hypothetical protein LTR16_002631 [Cryomyces antarcticus]
MSIDPDFKPPRSPWEQRLCLCPEGDFYKSLQSGKVNVVTDHISSVNAHSVTTDSGKTVDTNIIITVTGLRLQLAGGARLLVDGKPIDVSERSLWKGVMLQDLPNAAFVIRYTIALWTLGADTTAKLVVRLLKHMDING